MANLSITDQNVLAHKINSNDLVVDSAEESLQTLRAHAEGRMHHLNRGICPDEVSGYDSRDPDCAVCRALDAITATPGPGRRR